MHHTESAISTVLSSWGCSCWPLRKHWKIRIVQREQDKALKQNALNTDNRLRSGFNNTNSGKNVQWPSQQHIWPATITSSLFHLPAVYLLATSYHNTLTFLFPAVGEGQYHWLTNILCFCHKTWSNGKIQWWCWPAQHNKKENAMTIETKKKQQHDKEKPNENQTKKRKRRETNTKYFKSIIFLKETGFMTLQRFREDVRSIFSMWKEAKTEIMRSWLKNWHL